MDSDTLKKAIRAIISIITILSTLYLFKEVLIPTNQNPIIEHNKEIVMFILGVLASIVGQIIGFYFGSSETDSRG